MVEMPKISLLLHNIRSTHNVGSIFSNCRRLLGWKNYFDWLHAFFLLMLGIHGCLILLKNYQANRKTALGASSSVPFEYHDNLLTWLDSNTLP